MPSVAIRSYSYGTAAMLPLRQHLRESAYRQFELTPAAWPRPFVRNIELSKSTSGFWSSLEQYANIQNQMQALRLLSPDWDGYDAPVPSDRTMASASAMSETLQEMRFIPDTVVASAEGGIAFCYWNIGRYAQIEILNSGECVATMFDRENPPRISDLSSSRDAIARIVGEIQAYLAFS